MKKEINKLAEKYMEVRDEIEKVSEMIDVLRFKSDTCTHIDVYVRGERNLNVIVDDCFLTERALGLMLQDLKMKEELLFQRISEERRK